MSVQASVIVARFQFRAAASRQFTAFGVNDLKKLMTKDREFGVISAYRAGLSKSQNKDRNAKLLQDLQKMGYKGMESMNSHWEDMATGINNKEKSIYVPGISFKDIQELGKKYEQDAILYKHPSGTVGVYDKEGNVTLAYDEDRNMAVDMDTDNKKEYSKARGLSFGLKLVDKKFKYDGKPFTRTHLEDTLDEQEGPKKGKGKEDFLSAMGDKKVPNPNKDSRKQHPQVMIKSLDWEHQKPHYERWREAR